MYISRFAESTDVLRRIEYGEEFIQSLYHFIEGVPPGLNTCDATSSLDVLCFFFASPDGVLHTVNTDNKLSILEVALLLVHRAVNCRCAVSSYADVDAASPKSSSHIHSAYSALQLLCSSSNNHSQACRRFDGGGR